MNPGRLEPCAELRVGIVIPSYQTARFIRDAIDSVVGQRWPSLRVVVMDGGSRDGTVDILREYGDDIEWVSERDRGQAHAIQKGFDRLDDCDVVGWLNSDDRLVPNAISQIAEAFRSHPDAVLVHGDVERIDVFGRWFHESRSVDLDYHRMRAGRGRVVQPGSFYARWAVHDAGGVDESYHLLMDVDLWTRLLRRGRAVRIPGVLAQFRVHEDAKSSARSALPYYRESVRLAFTHERDRLPTALVRRLFRIAVHATRRRVARDPASSAPSKEHERRHRVQLVPQRAEVESVLAAAGFEVVAPGAQSAILFEESGDPDGRVVRVGQPELIARRPAFVLSDTRPAGVESYRWAPPVPLSNWARAAQIAAGANPVTIGAEEDAR